MFKLELPTASAVLEVVVCQPREHGVGGRLLGFQTAKGAPIAGLTAQSKPEAASVEVQRRKRQLAEGRRSFH
jgi:hypothetical protein